MVFRTYPADRAVQLEIPDDLLYTLHLTSRSAARIEYIVVERFWFEVPMMETRKAIYIFYA